MNEEKLKLEIENLTKRINTMEDLIKNKPRRMTRLKWLIVALVFISIILFTAGDISGSKTVFTTGTTISATHMNSNFDALFNLVNGNINNVNLASDSASLARVSGGVMSELNGDIITTADLFVGDDLEVGGYLDVEDGIDTNGSMDVEGSLDVDGDADFGGNGNDGEVFVRNSEGQWTIRLRSDYSGGGVISVGDSSGNTRVTIEADSGGGAIFVNGTEVNDYAEVFELSNKNSIKPGMVVIIDQDNPGNLKISSDSYDKKVAGIISGAEGSSPGFIVGTRKDGSNDKPVALSGRVYCYVDTSYGKIETGDLLTTSPIEGYAMKATDFSKAQGAILGKAMEPYSDGKGLILVLITLQ